MNFLVLAWNRPTPQSELSLLDTQRGTSRHGAPSCLRCLSTVILFHPTCPPCPHPPRPLLWHLHWGHAGGIQDTLGILFFFRSATFWVNKHEMLEGFCCCRDHPLLRVANHGVKSSWGNGRPRGTQSQLIEDLKCKRKPCLASHHLQPHASAETLPSGPCVFGYAHGGQGFSVPRGVGRLRSTASTDKRDRETNLSPEALA